MKNLLALAILVLFACGGPDETQLGSLEEKLVYVLAEDAVTPASVDIDFRAVADTAGPFWVSFSMWIDQDDGAAGAMLADMEYIDPVGETRVVSGMPISLGDPTGFSTTGPTMVSLLSGTSAWVLHLTLAGPAGTALIGYRTMHSAGAPTDFQDWN